MTAPISRDSSETGSNSRRLPIQQVSEAEDPHQSGSQTEELSSIWKNWLRSVSKELQPILKEVVIFTVYILADLFILWLAGFAFGDIDKIYPIIGLIYNGLKIASVLVLSIHFLVNCVVEMKKERQRIHQKE